MIVDEVRWIRVDAGGTAVRSEIGAWIVVVAIAAWIVEVVIAVWTGAIVAWIVEVAIAAWIAVIVVVPGTGVLGDGSIAAEAVATSVVAVQAQISSGLGFARAGPFRDLGRDRGRVGGGSSKNPS